MVIAIVCAASPVAHAVQVPVINVEKLRSDAADDGISGVFTAGITLGGGNVYSLKVDVGGRAYLRSGRHQGLVLLGVDYSSRTSDDNSGLEGLLDEESRFENAALGHLRYGYELTGPLTAEAFVQYQVDEFLLLEQRTLVGGGLRTRVLEAEGGSVHLGAGYMLERETLDPDRSVEAAGALAHRLSSYIAARWVVGRSVSLNFTGYVQPRFDDPTDYRLLGEGALEVGLSETFSLLLPLRVRFDSDPTRVREGVPPVEAVDFEVQPTLQASF